MTQKTNLLFVGGDLSGIQRYIYNITSKKAAVSLKGRSAWLNKFMTEVHDELIEQLEKMDDYPKSVYCSGGKFYLIAPDTERNREFIDKIAKEREQELWEKHYAQVAIAIDFVEFDFAADEEKIVLEGQTTDFTKLFSAISKCFSKTKNKKFNHLISSNYNHLFEPQAVGGEDIHVCAVTGIEGATIPFVDGKYITKEVYKQIKLGEALRNLDDVHETFEKYAHPYIAVLRMDVDGLGAKFMTIKTQKEYNTFSKRLDDFFLSKIDWTNEDKPEYEKKSTLYDIWENNYRNDSIIIYAGGDDIFVVGQWDKVINFAREIQQKFTRTFGEDGITLSGGVAIVGGKFPIAKGAELAAEAEEAAKNYVHPLTKQEKNAFTMFGQTISWNDEFVVVEKYKTLFCKHIQSGLSRSVLHRIMVLNERKERSKDYIWHTVYFLTRLKEREKDYKDFTKQLQADLLSSPRQYELIALAARWAEISVRE